MFVTLFLVDSLWANSDAGPVSPKAVSSTIPTDGPPLFLVVSDCGVHFEGDWGGVRSLGFGGFNGQHVLVKVSVAPEFQCVSVF